MRRRVVGAAAAASLTLASCGVLDQDDPDVSETVVRGVELAPAELGRAPSPGAQYLDQSEEGAVTLNIDDSHDGVCTSDANPYTFLVQGLPETPTSLTVRAGEQDDLEVDL